MSLVDGGMVDTVKKFSEILYPGTTKKSLADVASPGDVVQDARAAFKSQDKDKKMMKYAHFEDDEPAD